MFNATRLGFYYLTAATGLMVSTVMMISDDGDLLIFQSLVQQSINFLYVASRFHNRPMTWFQARDYCLDQVPVVLDSIRCR